MSDDVEYQKIWFELQALAWNRPELRERVARVNDEWRAVLTEAFAEPRERYGIDMPLDALVSLVITFNRGSSSSACPASRRATRELLDWIDGWLEERTMTIELRGTGDASRRARANRTTEGYVERDGVRVFYEVYGAGEPTVFLLPTWSIIHSRHWKMQIPYLARHCRVVTFDGRGNGRSDRPPSAEAYARARVRRRRAGGHGRDRHRARRRSSALSLGAQRALLLAAEHPERVDGAVFIAPARRRSRRAARRARASPVRRAARHRRGLGEVQPPLLARATTAGFLEFFFSQMLHRAALDQADRGLRRLGPRDDARDADRDAARPRAARRGRRRATLCRASAARCS